MGRGCASLQDDAYIELVSELPPWITWVTLDNCLTSGGRKRTTVQLLATALRSRWTMSAGITGLALRNHHYTLDELHPLIELLRLPTSSQPARPPAEARPRAPTWRGRVPPVPSGRCSPQSTPAWVTGARRGRKS